jgi:hypothetical protein
LARASHSTRRITAVTDDSLSSHAHELDLAPAPAFAAQANGTAEMYEAAAADHEGFWAQQARERITWATDFERTLDWDDAPFAKWFVGGQLNVASTASTGTSRPATVTGSRSTSRARAATPAPSPTPTSSARSARPPTP